MRTVQCDHRGHGVDVDQDRADQIDCPEGDWPLLVSEPADPPEGDSDRIDEEGADKEPWTGSVSGIGLPTVFLIGVLLVLMLYPGQAVFGSVASSSNDTGSFFEEPMRPSYQSGLRISTAKEQAREILQGGPFQTSSDNRGQTEDQIGEKIQDRKVEKGQADREVQEQENSWFLPAIAGAGTLLEIFVWTLLAIAGFFILFAILTSIKRSGTGSEHQTDEETREEKEEEEEIDRSGMEQIMKEADQLAEQGHYTEAIRYMFLDATRRIEDVRSVRLQASDTNHEYLARLNRDDLFRRLCKVLVQGVDKFFYGGRPCEKDDYERCREAWKEVQSRSTSSSE